MGHLIATTAEPWGIQLQTPTNLKISVKLDYFPKYRGENQKILETTTQLIHTS